MIFTFKNSTDWISLIKVASIDDEYFNAIKNNDIPTVKKLIEEKAKSSGYVIGPVYHGTDKNGLHEFFGGWWSQDKKVTKEFGKELYSAFLKGPLASGEDLRKMYIEFNETDIDPDSENSLYDSEIADAAMSGGPFSRFVKENNWKGIEVFDESNMYSSMSYSVFDPENIKSSNTITYDNSGNIIPLSQRFNSSNPDIRY